MDLAVLDYILIAASLATISFIVILVYSIKQSITDEQDIKNLLEKCILLPGQDAHTSDVREHARNLNKRLRVKNRTLRGRK
jgi:hypothetical protein